MKNRENSVWVIIAVIAGATVGLWAGKSSRARTKMVVEQAVEQAVEGAQEIRQPVSAAGSKARTLESVLRGFRDTGLVPKSAADFLARASRKEIFEAMEAQVNSLGLENGWIIQDKAANALAAAAREIYRREGLAGVEWAEAHGSEAVVRAMVNELSRNDAVGAQEHWRMFSEKFEAVRSIGFSAEGVRGAAMRGAADLLQAEALANSYGVGTEFAAGFDFPGYLAKSKSEENVANSYKYWAAMDPEAAAKGLREGLGGALEAASGGQNDRFVAAFQGRAAQVGEEAAAAWISGVMDAIPEEDRKREVRMLGTGGVTVARVQALMQNLPEEQDRIGFAVMAVGMAGENDNGMESVGAQPSEDFRVKVAQAWLENARGWRWGALDDSLERLMNGLRLPEPSREELREALSKMPPTEPPDGPPPLDQP